MVGTVDVACLRGAALAWLFANAGCQLVTGLDALGLAGGAAAGGAGSGTATTGTAGAGGACPPPDEGTAPLLIAKDILHPVEIAVDADDVFWLEAGSGIGGGRLWRLPKRPCATPEVVVAGAQVAPRLLVLTPGAVFWTIGEATVQALWRLDRATDEAAAVPDVPQQNFTDLRADATHLYIAGGALRRTELAPGAAWETLLKEPVMVNRIDPRDDSAVYYSAGDRIERTSKDDPTPVTLYEGVFILDIAVLPDAVAWSESGELKSLPKAGGPTGYIAGNQEAAVRLAVGPDPDVVFWVNQGKCDGETLNGSVVMGSVSNAFGATHLASELGCPAALAVDESFVYYTDDWTASVWRVRHAPAGR